MTPCTDEAPLPRPPLSRRRLLATVGALAGGAVTAWYATGGADPDPDLAPPAPRLGRPPIIAPPHDASWLSDERVHAFTRLGPRTVDTGVFARAGAEAARLGARVLVRHVKSNREPILSDAAVSAMVAEAHRAGVRLVAYYWLATDEAFGAAHPGQLCRTSSGDRAMQGNGRSLGRGQYLDLSGPYGQVVEDDLVRLAGLGVDGFYFDETHWPAEGCFGTGLERDFRLASRAAGLGRDYPPGESTSLLAFQAERLKDLFERWKAAVQRESPHVAFVVSCTFLPSLADQRTPSGLAALSDAPKSEFRSALARSADIGAFDKPYDVVPPPDRARMAAGYLTLRDAADGRPPHIWGPGFPDGAHARAFVGAVTGFGGIAAMDIPEGNLSADADPGGPTNRQALRSAFELGRDISGALRRTIPLRWAAIHFSERTRDARSGRPDLVWSEVLWPTVGALMTLAAHGVPVGFVTDAQLAEGRLDGYGLLVIPNESELDARQRQTVETFGAEGGQVRPVPGSWGWGHEPATSRSMSRLSALVQDDVARAPVRVRQQTTDSYVVTHQGPSGRLVLAVIPDFTFVQQASVDRPVVDVSAPRRSAGLSLVLADPGSRALVRDAITGRRLAVTRAGDATTVHIPPFDTTVWLAVDFTGPG